MIDGSLPGKAGLPEQSTPSLSLPLSLLLAPPPNPPQFPGNKFFLSGGGMGSEGKQIKERMLNKG